MEQDLDGRLSVRARLIPGRRLWCWEIVDALEGEVIESSWNGQWSGYLSRQEAMAAGLNRLLEKTRGSRRTPGRRAPRIARAVSPVGQRSRTSRSKTRCAA